MNTLSDLFFTATITSFSLKDIVYGLAILFIVFLSLLKRTIIIKKESLTKINKTPQLIMNSSMGCSQERQFPLKLAKLSINKIMNGKYSDKEYKTILYSVDHMLVFISDLLNNQNKSLNNIENNIINTDISLLVKQLLSAIEIQNEDKHIIITYSQAEQNITMDVDRMKMIRMILNVYFYTIKYTKGSGGINIHLNIGNQEDIIKSHNTVYIKGSLPKHCPIISLKFFIYSNSVETLKEPYVFCKKINDEEIEKDTELVVIRDIVLLHKGTVIINDKQEKNQEIIVALPIYNNHLIEKNKTFNTNTSTCKQSNSIHLKNIFNNKLKKTALLLVITNDTNLQNVLKEKLYFSYDIHFTDKIEEGLKMCATLFPDILICDIITPQIDGIKMCKQIKRDSLFANIPVVLLSDKKMADKLIERYEVGADVYIFKPFSIRLLEENLQQLLSRKKLQKKINSKSYKNICEYDENDKKTTLEALFSPEERERMMNKLKQIIEEHIDDPNLSSKQLSIDLGISRSKLYRELKNIDGLSLANYIRSVRLERARELLIHSDHTSKEITEMIGFVNLSHFSRVFKEKYKMTPREFKKKNT